MDTNLIQERQFKRVRELIEVDGVYRNRHIVEHQGLRVEIYFGSILDGSKWYIAKCGRNFYQVEFDEGNKCFECQEEFEEHLEELASLATEDILWTELKIEDEKERRQYGSLQLAVEAS